MLLVLQFRVRPIVSWTAESVDSAVQQTSANRSQTNADEGASVGPDMVGRGDNTDPNGVGGGQQISRENRSNDDLVGLS